MTTGDKIIKGDTLRDNRSLSRSFRYLQNNIKKLLASTIFVMLCIPVNSWAACSWNGNTGTVASPYSQSELASCVSDASGKTGNVLVQIPSCSVSYSSAISVNMRSGFTNVTGLTIRGQNDCTLDSTGRPTACGTNIANFGVNYTGKEGKSFRVAHLKITGNSESRIDGDSKSWRFDHIFYNQVTSTGSGRIYWVGKGTLGWTTYGVFDHLNVYDTPGIFLGYYPSADGGNYEWMHPLGLGTAEAYYIEDSTFYNLVVNGSGAITDSNGSGKFVIRHNDITNAQIQAHDAIVNGYRGVMKWEVYNNTFTYTDSSSCFVLQARGGTGVFFNNTINDTNNYLCGTYGIQFGVYRTYQTGGNPWDTLCPNSSGNAILDSSSNYPQNCTSGTGCIPKDGSASSPSGYPCRDQLGASGNNPQVGGGQPFLLWNNHKGNDYNVAPSINGTASYIVSGRDYCTAATTMPSSCNGVTTTYTPYTYPHLLTQTMYSISNPPLTRPNPPYLR